MPSLTRDEAVTRAALLTVDTYHVDLDLTAVRDSEEFSSVTTIRFSCAAPEASTFVELRPTRVLDASLNGMALDPGSLVDDRMPLTDLAAMNELTIRAAYAYSNTGEGLHRFVDPEDGETYLYAQSFLDDAQRIFACFDQPDLKARFTLSVTAPAGWLVAANSAGTETAPGRWVFAETQPLSTYLISLIAGPYHVRQETHDGIPLALYCRRGLAPHLDKDVEEIFEVTRACLDRYHELFGVRYPFGKYDQAFVPEFNAGAMENAGLVTFRDEFVFRSTVADDDREQRAMVIAHEMAHMWFGDLVTMRWWDDLWLNESFAEYMAYRLTAEVTRFKQAWTGFTVGRKGWGYAADQRPSTHPVAPESVPDTGMALLNFDGISYAKGAAVLRQLVAWLGDDAFLAGLRAHFAAHAFGNAGLDDLLASLHAAAPERDLRAWSDGWLRQAQVNTLRPVVSIVDGAYASVEIVQTAPADHPTLRPHRIDVGVYQDGARRLRTAVDLEPAVDHGRTAVADLVGVPAGDLLLVNDGDLTYAKIRFDQVDLRAVLPGLRESLSRALVWAAAADSVRDGELAPSEFVALVGVGVPVETEAMVLRDLVRFTTNRAVDAAFAVGGMTGRFLPPERVAAAERSIADAFWSTMTSAPAGSGVQLLTAQGFVAAARDDGVATLKGWLVGDAVPDALEIGPDLRWSILARLALLGEVGEGELDEELARDRTSTGVENASRSRASLPDAAVKARAWESIMRDDTSSNRLTIAVAEGFWQPGQEALTASYVDRYFEEVPAMAARRSPWMTTQVAEAAFPRFAAEQGTITRADELLARPDVGAALRRVVVDLTDELRRAFAGRTLERS